MGGGVYPVGERVGSGVLTAGAAPGTGTGNGLGFRVPGLGVGTAGDGVTASGTASETATTTTFSRLRRHNFVFSEVHDVFMTAKTRSAAAKR